MPERRMTAAEWRTVIANRLFGGTPLLGMISAVKWTVYPHLVSVAPNIAIAVHEPESTRAFWAAIQPGMIVIDGGSNRGGYSMLASRKTGPDGRVFAFEPEPENYQRLTRRLAKLTNVVTVQKAISGASGEAVLHLDTFHAGHTLSREVGEGKTVKVGVTSLDDFVRDRALPGLDVVKLDIEGAELDAIVGMREILSGGRRPVILCEVHAPLTPEQIISALGAFGYECQMLDAELTGTDHSVPVHLLATPPPNA